ncbi:MAG: outer membrane beta-barrel protein [Bacteroidetes bacterium]|nr:outer membrane beta-barrel protein [Bacteroidota bacterium]
MESKDIDNLFKNSLKNFREEPPEVVKENIYFELDKTENNQKGFFSRRKYFFLLSILTLCVIGATTIYFLSITPPSEKLLSENHVNNRVQKEYSNVNSQNQKELSQENNLNNSPEQKIKNSEILDKKTNENKNGLTNFTNKKTKEVAKENLNNINNTNSENNKILIKETIDSKTTLNTKNKISLSQENINNKAVVENNNTEISTNQIQEKNNSSIKIAIENNATKEIDKNVITENPVNKNPQASANSDSLKKVEIETSQNIVTNNQPIIKKKNTLFKNLSAELFVAPVYCTKTLSGLNSDYLNLRKENEKPLLTYNIGLELKYSIKNFFLQTGVNYSNVGEKINYNTNTLTNIDSSASHWELHSFAMIYVDTISWDSTHGFAIMTTSVPIMDSIWQYSADSTYTLLQVKNTNQLSYIEIPILIGYSFGKRKLSYQASTGVSFGFLSGSKGKLLKTDASGFNDILVETPFKKTLYNFLFRIGCTYHLNENLSIILQPSFKLNLNSVFESTYPTSQKYQSYGLNLGLNYKF